ncbi:DUF6580 family putative transport protein [Kordiimonas aquimaris]|uniref:DUF6580 family putative transport protein n=1 Tax=Kordiimonas aquimaris TaxID=707591 RepID=UPI0021CFA433|nr:DUF6580 family putative transport protein [Kordiimonas aquimaris]
MHIFLIMLAAIGRAIPHPWGFTPLGGVGLFAGANVSLRMALLIPFVPLFIGDALIGFYDLRVFIAVYIGHMCAPLIGRYLIAGRIRITTVAGGVALNAVAFYLISNFGSFITYYEHSMTGLITCYVNGLPYLGVSLVGDSVYATVLFGGQYILKSAKASEEGHQA